MRQSTARQHYPDSATDAPQHAACTIRLLRPSRFNHAFIESLVPYVGKVLAGRGDFTPSIINQRTDGVESIFIVSTEQTRIDKQGRESPKRYRLTIKERKDYYKITFINYAKNIRRESRTELERQLLDILEHIAELDAARRVVERKLTRI